MPRDSEVNFSYWYFLVYTKSWNIYPQNPVECSVYPEEEFRSRKIWYYVTFFINLPTTETTSHKWRQSFFGQLLTTIIIHELHQFVVIRQLTVKSKYPFTWIWVIDCILRQVCIKGTYQGCIKSYTMDCIKGKPALVLELFLLHRHFFSHPRPLPTNQIKTLLLLGQIRVKKDHDWVNYAV